MATLVSPGISVSVVDESAYASPGAGTIPLLVLATRENKTDPTNTYSDGIALYTKASLVNNIFTVTSQRELTQYFGTPVFRKAGETVVEGDETSEYGLLAAYSYLGQGSLAYVVRANIDLGKLEPRNSEPTGPLEIGTLWLDSDASSYGVFVYNNTDKRWATPALLVTAQRYADDENPNEEVEVSPDTIVNIRPSGTILVLFTTNTNGTRMSYWKSNGTVWERITSSTATYAPHYAPPELPSNGDIWIKTTRPANGVNLSIYASDGVSEFNPVTVQGLSVDGTSFVPQDGTSNVAITAINEDAIQLIVNAENGYISLVYRIDGANFAITGSSVNQTFIAATAQPTGEAVDGELWFDETIYDATLDRGTLDIMQKVGSAWARVDKDNIIYSTTRPSTASVGDIWVDLSATAREYPKLYRYVDTAGWILHDNTDQTTEYGVLFADISSTELYTTTGLTNTSIELIDDTDVTGYVAPPAVLYPAGILAINMCASTNTVRIYKPEVAGTLKWRNAAPNHADGSGSFGRYAQRKVIATRMQAAIVGNTELEDQTRPFTLLCAPNYPELTGELNNLNANRGETGFVVIDTPMRKAPNEVVTWVNGNNAVEDGEDGLISKNRFSAVYYPAVRTTTPTGDTVTVPPSHAVLYQFAYSDNISYPWFAAAGLTRGIVQNASGGGYITTEGEFRSAPLNQGQRDSLYINKVNPIATFPSEGLVVFGNKTLNPITSSLDRVNVARLVSYLRERFEIIGRPFLFEPNDKSTRDRTKAVYENFLLDILSKRGITDFAIVCDESNNTPSRIDRNELWVDIAIVPTKSVEFIYIPLRLVNTGEI